jgi:ubiquinone biosynthesis protein UbiJ
VSDGGGTWVLTVRGSEGVLEATEGDADCSVRISAGALLDIINGRENVIAAFAQGKIQLAGDYALANKLAQVLFG